MTITEIRANLAAYRNDGRMFSPHEWAGMVETLEAKLAEAEAACRAWYAAASPFATPEALREGLAEFRAGLRRCRLSLLRAQNETQFGHLISATEYTDAVNDAMKESK